MAELGAGSGTGYPTAIDTDATIEVNEGGTGPTTTRAAVPNDMGAAIVAIQTELGTIPKGSYSTVKDRLTGLSSMTKRRLMFPAPCFETRSSGTAGWAAYTQTAGTNLDYGQLDFDPSTDEAAYTPPFYMEGYNAGSLIITLFWKTTATTGNVIWNASFLGRAITEVWDAGFSAHAFSAAGAGDTSGDLIVTSLTVTPSELAEGDLVVMKISRDADNVSDNMAADASLLAVWLEYAEG